MCVCIYVCSIYTKSRNGVCIYSVSNTPPVLWQISPGSLATREDVLIDPEEHICVWYIYMYNDSIHVIYIHIYILSLYMVDTQYI